jgi:MarR family transcriptional regulator, transcriptional regulator for hemolysin
MEDKSLSPARAVFGRTLVHVARFWRRRADEALAAYGLSEATAVPLMALARTGDGARPGALAERLGIECPSLVRLVDALEADGLLLRRADPADRRAKTLHLTAKGAALAAQAEEVLNGVRRRLLKDVGERDVETALEVLRAVACELRRADAEPETTG